MQLGHRALTFLIATFLTFVTLSASAASPQPTTQPINRFESSILAYEKKDREAPPAPGGTLFVGSSTFAMWKDLEADFRAFHAINRGFGGSTIPEVLHYANRIVLPYKPATIVLYAGENDIVAGHSPDRVLANFQTFVQTVHKALPDVRIYYLSAKAAPTRLRWAPQIEQANRLIHQFVQKTPNLAYIDAASLLFDDQGRPRTELYLSDQLHLNRQGQEAWIPVIRNALPHPVP